MKNIRFWTYAHNSWVKLTLKSDDSLMYQGGGKNDEGYNYWTETFWLDAEKKQVFCGMDSMSNDCDGKITTHTIYSCSLDELKNNKPRLVKNCSCLGFDDKKLKPFVHEKFCRHELIKPEKIAPFSPDWQEVKNENRDYYAECMGY